MPNRFAAGRITEVFSATSDVAESQGTVTGLQDALRPHHRQSEID
jgi:hypothetical protein